MIGHKSPRDHGFTAAESLLYLHHYYGLFEIVETGFTSTGFIFIFFRIYCLKQCRTIIGGSFNFSKLIIIKPNIFWLSF